MVIHEHNAKQIFAGHGIPVTEGDIAATPGEAEVIARRIGKPVVVKAQVHVGGRGKAGGILFADDPETARAQAEKILGMTIKGLPVHEVLVTTAEKPLAESYVGIVLDRNAKKPVIMVSSAGGVDIEDVAARTPEKIRRQHIDPVEGIHPYQARRLAYYLYDDPVLAKQAADIILKLYGVFEDCDASLAEINPLIANPEGRIIALDAKMNIDDNALYRQPAIASMRDPKAEDPAEAEAREAGLSYIKLGGTIGCIVNGAGLAMATMDLVKRYGGEPANFLDIGGSSNPQKVVTAIKIILSDPKVRAILINILGGITRCDDVATGIVEAFRQFQPAVPVVIRLAGTNEAAAADILRHTGLPTAPSLDEVVKKAIEMSRAQDSAQERRK
ncbi:MAG TPA: ADP-forming succinate--CoA ligase subunit beta [Candidatus Hydrogenedentes bacterium]|nr:ADP-forming succinate--CoA ligase subunit beta [Candidatus Hydrogenedentota bacterium]HRT21919.1 ADP-forming succinate--CoA ligase subunit beta [Candidatus Hydrogenedentota bacterium]HRT66911.1 ADP-forming succinate--CoA ligase subunit beta [Candidatus Hydrogenedentota bacterium]